MEDAYIALSSQATHAGKLRIKKERLRMRHPPECFFEKGKLREYSAAAQLVTAEGERLHPILREDTVVVPINLIKTTLIITI